jgi:ABC-type Mn2+/Zn2+ transport system ATPase subunit
MPSLIEIHGASFGYGRKVVLTGVDLQVERGAFLGVFGPNGSGKTTLFRGILGLDSPLAGRVERSTEAIGYVPQRERLDPVYPLTVEEVVHMGAYAALRGRRGVSRDMLDAARRWLDRVELSHKRRALFASLSGGQRQRALIARALMCNPELVVLDEPTSGVDRQAEQRILEILRSLNEEGLAILLVSHQLEVVCPSLKDAIWVDEGRVRHGVLEEVLARRPVPEIGQGPSPETGEAAS